MQLRIAVDQRYHEIDTIDPELLGRWIVEIFTRTGPWTNATYVQVQSYPSWVATPDGRGRLDWIADSRILNFMQRVHTPQEVVDALQQQINELEALNADR